MWLAAAWKEFARARMGVRRVSQVGTLSLSHPSFGVPVLFIYLFATRGRRYPMSALRLFHNIEG